MARRRDPDFNRIGAKIAGARGSRRVVRREAKSWGTEIKRVRGCWDDGEGFSAFLCPTPMRALTVLHNISLPTLSAAAPTAHRLADLSAPVWRATGIPGADQRKLLRV